MKNLLPILPLLMLAACGTRAPLAARTIPYATLEHNVIVGQSTRAQVLAALGPSTALVFDSGYQVWMYAYPLGSDGHGEYVILFDPDGRVKKTRRRESATD
ncbi:hypothetical protein [Janthinobacterium agaricidamnosum]|uniref:Putative lipoprotein n=1 Tax=Janthinobacterium agaricidamnosum NBRC 102515 = DSM 9628 TaxID=1349767 RepID=W0V943_9BURK|nr:hypothetical protein [Janthinobacterium agaricidamnosum]CDG85349.1 putative lipoprotein [Janthinobacterium agaricidamnosum NBRC 102515 = DSM 9628]